MFFSKQHLSILFFTLAYTLGFGIYYVLIRDYEFLWYIAVLLFFTTFIAATLRKSQLTVSLLWLLSVWGLVHMAGGGIVIGDHVLYGQVLIPITLNGDFTLLKFDQLVHAYGFGVVALVSHFLLSRAVGTSMSFLWLATVSVLIATGLGAINEIVEFAAVIAIPDTGVGGYFNTSLDLVFNTLGAIAAMILLYIFHKSTKYSP